MCSSSSSTRGALALSTSGAAASGAAASGVRAASVCGWARAGLRRLRWRRLERAASRSSRGVGPSDAHPHRVVALLLGLLGLLGDAARLGLAGWSVGVRHACLNAPALPARLFVLGHAVRGGDDVAGTCDIGERLHRLRRLRGHC